MARPFTGLVRVNICALLFSLSPDFRPSGIRPDNSQGNYDQVKEDFDCYGKTPMQTFID
jgi:hypothetical protein